LLEKISYDELLCWFQLFSVQIKAVRRARLDLDGTSKEARKSMEL
jgi:hypothetical protein